jgi:heterodisulfide reductase subunit C/nitrate reductase gamma subunit
MAFFDFGLILAFAICAAGLVRRVTRWRPSRPGGVATGIGAGVDPGSGLFIAALKALVIDVLLLGRTVRTSPLRWLAHCLVFFGFIGLLLFHALDDTVAAYFFPAMEPTLDPWQFLRNLFGVMTLVGLALMVWRRLAVRGLRPVTRTQDWAALLVVGGIILSGFFLEASKMLSPAVFGRMTDDYFVMVEGRDMTALQAYWAEKNGVVFSMALPSDAATLDKGASLNADSCADCHADTRSAFISRPLATALGPLAQAMNTSRADRVFWYCHILFCLVGLAALPWGKLLHPLSTPANLLVRRGRRDGGVVGLRARFLGMDACTRCGECSLRCSVAPSFRVLGNPDILPSEKLASLKSFWSDVPPTGRALADFAQGSRICTLCLRCTDICPAGINLQELWLRSRPQAAQASPEPNAAVRNMGPARRVTAFERCELVPPVSGLADNAESFWACVQCTTCTSVCPVVAVSKDPAADLDLTPQQIMNLLRMGLKDQALGVRMVWSCVTCYKCQEHCPQNIRVADVLYELRNTAAVRMGCGGRTVADGENQ